MTFRARWWMRTFAAVLAVIGCGCTRAPETLAMRAQRARDVGHAVIAADHYRALDWHDAWTPARPIFATEYRLPAGVH